VDRSHTTPEFPTTLGSFDVRRTPVLRTDVLVIGGGIAGSSAALQAAELGASVLVLSKTALEDTNTASAQGGIAAVLMPEDSSELHIEDTLCVGGGIADAEIAKWIISQSRQTLDRLQDLGAVFDRDREGSYELSTEGGHSIPRVVHARGDATGAEIQRALTSALQAHPQVTLKTGPFVRDLLVHEGRCVGAVSAIDSMDLAVNAGAVIAATGGCGQIYRETTNPIGACGDGLAFCFRAGARLADMEFIQFHPTTLYIAGASRFLISEAVRGAGATLRDRNGERFMEGIHPAAELAPRDVVSRAILERMVQTGDTHVYLDLGTVDSDPHVRFPSISKICRAFDIDIAVDHIPVRPGAHYCIGGAAVDRSGRTSVPGLYAVGESAATFLHGANRLASNSLLEGGATGFAAGTAAAEEARDWERSRLPLAVAGVPAGENAPRIHLDDMLYSLKSLMGRQVGLHRDREGMAEARQRVGLWNHYLLRGGPSKQRACELANMLTVSSLVTEAALRREESRGTHFRTDHPQRDDSGWCRHLFLERGEDGSIQINCGPTFPPTDKT
jgi:L-aspartate oxidase